MASRDEQRAIQASTLYFLLDIKSKNPDAKIKGLKKAISHVKATMTEPEISWVEKQIRESEDDQ